jgi:hypothetical protein
VCLGSINAIETVKKQRKPCRISLNVSTHASITLDIFIYNFILGLITSIMLYFWLFTGHTVFESFGLGFISNVGICDHSYHRYPVMLKEVN